MELLNASDLIKNEIHDGRRAARTAQLCRILEMFEYFYTCSRNERITLTDISVIFILRFEISSFGGVPCLPFGKLSRLFNSNSNDEINEQCLF